VADHRPFNPEGPVGRVVLTRTSSGGFGSAGGLLLDGLEDARDRAAGPEDGADEAAGRAEDDLDDLRDGFLAGGELAQALDALAALEELAVEDGALDLHLLELLGPVDEFAGDVDDRLAIYQGAGALEDGVKRGELAVAEGLGGELVAHDGDADVLAAQ